MKTRLTVLTTLALALGLWIPQAAWAQGCAMCKTALEGGNDQVALAFNWGILLLMAAPYGILASVGGWLGYTYWRKRPAREAALRVLPLRPTQKETLP